MRSLPAAILLLALAACNPDMTGQSAKPESDQVATGDASVDQMTSDDPRPGETARAEIPDSQERPLMQLQVVLDRLGFTPGVIDGKMGLSTRNAISGFQEANDLSVTGQLDEETRRALARWENIPATRIVTIPARFAAEEFQQVPDDPEKQSSLKRLGYESLDEKLTERFHTTIATLRMLNPGGVPAGTKGSDAGPRPLEAETANREGEASREGAPPNVARSTSGGAQQPNKSAASFFRAGQKIRVPNVGADRIVTGSVSDETWLDTLRSLGVGSEQPKAARVVVSKSAGTLKAYGADGKLVGMYTATMGSQRDPLPLGNWAILAIAHNPPFSYNPELFWDVPDSQAKQTLPPGPNGPIGVVWIDLSKEHYGIHGTPDPETIGRVQSHGCVRLTNWDAARLAQMVSTRTEVLFET
jgi:lipoprotein-anchoring transpeptidase ErfK/SrfK